MSSIFSQEQFPRFDLGRQILQGRKLAQPTVNPYLSLAEKDELLGRIQEAVKLTKPIDDIMSWSGDNDPGLKSYLGLDSTRFFALSNSIADLYPTVSDVGQRLQEKDAEYWFRPSAEELAAIKQWTTGVTEMYKLLDKKKAQVYTPAPGMKVPPSILPAATGRLSSGPSTTEILIGGGLAVGLGVVLYSLFS